MLLAPLPASATGTVVCRCRVADAGTQAFKSARVSLLACSAVQDATGTSVSTFGLHRRLGISAMSLGLFQLTALLFRWDLARQQVDRLHDKIETQTCARQHRRRWC